MTSGALVSGMSDLLRRTLGEDIAIETVLAGGLWQTRVDTNQLENALLNLAVNARDAMPDGGKLTIETANTSLDDAYAAAHAEVTAGAICAARRDRHRRRHDAGDHRARRSSRSSPPSRSARAPGSACHMVYGFVKQSGGHVAIYSEPGHGTTLKVYLPRFIRPDAKPPASAGTPGATAWRR